MLDRRTFLIASAAIPAGAVALGELFILPDDRKLLLNLARALLPSELGAARMQQTVERFERWISYYRAGAEANHGYGTGRLEALPADPWPRWRVQLQALDGLSAAQLQSLPALVSAERLTAPLAAPHIALALLAWFYATPEANDLCHQARILRDSCRPLGTVGQKP